MALAGIALRDWRAQGSDFTFRGQQIRYWSAGSGAPLLLVHGFPTASWDWHYLWQPLAERYRLIACDMLGFGDSAKPRGHDYRILEQADLQQALLEHLGVREPVHLLVHDYGNSVGQELLARHEKGGFALASLAFLNGGLFPETHRAVLSQKLLLGPFGALFGRLFDRKRLAQNFAKVFGPQTQPSEAELDAFWELIRHNDGPRVMHRLIHYILDRRQHRERWVGAMQRTAVPLRLIDGPEDPISGAHMVVRYRELIPRPDTVELPGIGHYPQVEAPELVLQHYLSFRQERAP
ncbi:alpha/beta fold hydrolase [Pseudomonas sp. PDM22]|uniref:alpha/beta fold hydrolase n=1 Tax=Pseudomonas sp. PDM22 TaxID=2769287 RepID=UPI0009DB5171|nr:alpha/beta hydrolase [Pseudomonas sp. PDM22]MBD9513133.1 alpha/beta hydrolase [Pseudomonas sp. PDM22]OQR37293.1 alpha/beta hydrolase [Pseudomonas sp. T]